jgi:hypothetical protein
MPTPPPPSIDPVTGDTLTPIRARDLKAGHIVQAGPNVRYTVDMLSPFTGSTAYVFVHTTDGKRYPLDIKYGQIVIVTLKAAA